MLPTLCTEFIVALIWIFVSNVHSHSTDCGKVNTALQNNNLEGAWPWMVAITVKERGGSYNPYCSGFLIDRRHVLTAAHCVVRNNDVSHILARIGKMNLNEGEAYKITCITKHPLYEMGLYYDDIAILTLSRDVDTPNYTPICLPGENLRIKSLSGLEVTKIAWGADTDMGTINETLIQSSGLRIISNRDCNKVFKKLVSSFSRVFPGGVSSDMICSEIPTGQRETCAGSGGAPLMYRDDRNKWIAVGLSSFGYSCGKGAPEGNTRVSAYVEWIIENTKDGKGSCS